MTEEKKQAGHFHRNRGFYMLLFAAITLTTFLSISKNMALKQQARAFAEEKTAFLEQAQQAVNTNTQKQLDIMMKTFVWAVRGEMTRGNMEQVNQYFKQLVKTDNIKEITLVDKTGKILISTNKKNEGSQLANEYSETVLKSEEVNVIDKADKKIVVAPVMDLDSRMGSLMIIYQPDRFTLSTSIELIKSDQ
ncbi:MAG: hypothetical protein DHS20C18_43780 [Saprospiraceae bacterium]|nr:MAG: hypothetical protein DHS20C18_43780 [Saprospiraceae bacterium]